MSGVRKKKILIIDDDEEVCALVKKGLETIRNCTVYSAMRGEEGLLLARQIEPDAVIVDLLLPDNNGLEISRKIKQDKLIGSTPVILLSGVSDEVAKEESRKLGNELYLTKPIAVTVLAEAIDKVLM